MVINLSKPFSVGDLAPDTTYPHVYIVKLASYGVTATVAVTYEFGTMANETATTPGTWTPCPFGTQSRIELTGQRLAPFYTTMGTPDVPLWPSIEAVIYAQIQQNDPRCAGIIGLAKS